MNFLEGIFFANVARTYNISKQIAKTKLSNVPEAEDEWQEVLKSVRRFGSYNQDKAIASLKPYTAKIVGYIGYQRICMAESDEQVWNKKEFISEYNSLKDKEIENLQIGNNKREFLLDNVKMIEE